MLTEKQQFKIGFLMKCAEAGLTIDETKYVVKQAIANIKAREKSAIHPALSIPLDAAKSVGNIGVEAIKALPGVLNTAGTVAVGAPLAAGIGTGYLAAKATTNDRDAVEDAKHEELLGEYSRLAEEARRRARIKRLERRTGERVVALTPEVT